MIPKECKRLAEVDFPIAVVSKHSAREKSIRHGHPSTLHLWWARRPLAACRSMLLALLWPDPCDEHCPEDFKQKARELLQTVQGKVGPADEDLRKALLKFIGDFANWDLSNNEAYLKVSRGLVKAAHGEEPPLVVDPFAGGGSIPLEALRVGCDAFASDLNPVACLILKVMLEDIPRHGPDLAEELRRVGAEIKQQAEKELAEFYPKDPDGATPIAYLWARTVRCESPNCGAEIPLMRSFWLCKKPNRKRALRYDVVRPQGGPPRVEFQVFEPKADKQVAPGTVTRAKATCLACRAVLPPERVRAQLAEQSGGADAVFESKGKRVGGARMLAVVTLRTGETGRHYRLPTDADYYAVFKARERLRNILDEWEHDGKNGFCPVPDEPLPPIGTLGFRVQRYGMLKWGDLFTVRQKLALVTLAQKLRERTIRDDKSPRDVLAVVLSRCADYWSSLCSWHLTGEKINHTYGRQALPIIWDFCEVAPLCDSSGNFDGALQWGAKVVEQCFTLTGGQVQCADATDHPLPNQSAAIWFTDPPYYDAVPYADLSDYFLVWQRRAAPDNPLLRDPFDPENPLAPKIREVVQDETKRENGRPKDRGWFEEKMKVAFSEGRRVLHEDSIGAVVFAHKTTEGWEALLSGMISGGWTTTGSWPVVTEMGARLRARESAALATSVHLVCRPRTVDAPVGDWGGVLTELPDRVHNWMNRLEREGVRGADLVFACIGPALEVFSRYSRVETAEGREVKLAEYLEKVWEIVGRTALSQVLGTDSPTDFGEDARLTALFLWTLRTANGSNGNGNGEHGDYDDRDEVFSEDEEAEDTTSPTRTLKGFTLPFDIVRRIAQPLGIRLERWNRRLLEIDKGIVRLLSLSRRAEFLIEPGVAHDLTLVESDRRAKSRKQMLLFEESAEVESNTKAATARGRIERETWSQLHLDSITTLDHVQKAMLLQKQGHTNALRELLLYEKHYRPEFVRLANALSALYPKGSEEKRLLDAMLLAVPR